MKKIFSARTPYSLLLGLLGILVFATSCSNNDYANAIPSTATAIVKVDATKLDSRDMETVFSAFFSKETIIGCGIDWKSDVYVFETIDGNFGLCAKVNSKDKLSSTFSALALKAKCGKLRQQGDLSFTDINNAWAVGYSSKSLVVLGPVSVAALPDAQRSIMKMLRQNEDASIVSRPIYTRLDSMNSAVAMVAQVQALPEKFVAPFTIGMPKNADVSQVLIAADFSKNKSVVKMNGEVFSFDKSIDAALKKANGLYRRIEGDYIECIPQNCCFGLFANVEGRGYIPLLQSNKFMQGLLVGMNTAIDFDNIVRSIDGDLVIASSGLFSGSLDMTMFAKVTNPTWTADVDYWKQSCPAGSIITGVGTAWNYSSSAVNFKFGLSGDTFYAVSDRVFKPSAMGPRSDAVSRYIQNLIKGSRMAMILNLSAMSSNGIIPQSYGGIFKPILGDVKAVVYVMK